MAIYRSLAIFAVIATLCPLNMALQIYQTRIPNAGNRGANVTSLVPAPFGTANQFCESVGHRSQCDGSPFGGGNPFGVAFQAAGRQFSNTLCMADSDGDGLSNGDELGDPDCTWTVGATPNRTTDISHPGFNCSTAANPFCLTPTTSPAVMTTSGQSSVGAAAILLFISAMLVAIQSLF